MSSAMGPGGDFSQAQVILSNLRAENKLLRRKTLNRILEEIKALEENFDKKCRVAVAIPKPKPQAVKLDSDDEEEDENDNADEGPHNNDIFQQTENESDLAIINAYGSVENLIKGLVLSLSDPVEKCRELAYESLTIIVEKSSKKTISSVLPVIIPTLIQRLAQPELIETSEEVRLLAVIFIGQLIRKCLKELTPFIDDLLYIMAATLVDPYHEVRIKSCEVTSLLGKTMPEVFHYNSERLVKPLCASITHQQSRVRKAVVECMGDVLQFGSHKPAEEYVAHLITRLFDSNPGVRKTVVSVVGNWMLNFSDRYSHFHRFLPVILTGMCDESPEVADLAENLWTQVGDKYLDENVEDYKDFVDFPAPKPQHYPEGVRRPNFGCRMLTHREVCKLIPGVTHDIMDWQDGNRQKSAQLLYYLILNCEEKITMHVEPLFQCMFRACLDSNQIVIQYVLKSASLMGYFAPFQTCWPLLEENLKSNASEGCLAVTCSYLKGVNPTELKSQLRPILQLISVPEINRTLHSGKLNWLVGICETLLALVPEQMAGEWAEITFQILLVIVSMSQSEEIIKRAQGAIDVLRQFCQLESVDELFGLYCGSILEDIKEANVEWTMSTPERLIFTAILTQAGSGIQKNIGVVLDILVSYLGPKRDPEVRLGLFTELATILRLYSNITDRLSEQQLDQIQFFVKTIIEDILSQNLVWRAGRSAAALRAASLNSLLTILIGKLLSKEIVISLSTDITSGCIGLLDDQYYLNRLYATKCLGELVASCDKHVDILLLNKIYPDLLKRLDDETKDVRVAAAVALSDIYKNLPEAYTVSQFELYFDHAVGVLIVHLDDRDENIQTAVQDTLSDIGSICPHVVRKKCEEFKGKHRTPDRCNQLLEKFKE